MRNVEQFFAEHFALFYGAGIAWIVAVLLFSMWRLHSQGKSIFAKAPNDAVFVERWTSGRSLKSFWSRLGNANNCLLVVVTPAKLIVRPHFPFNIFLRAGVFGLELEVPLAAIQDVSILSGFFGDKTKIEFVTKSGMLEGFELRLRSPEKFHAAIGKDTVVSTERN